MPNFPCRKLLIALGIALQMAVPAWLIVKRACVLTYGERHLIEVTVQDPRDLWMGHWVRLSPVGSLPEPLDNLPDRKFLRYYCDQRYALTIEDYLRDRLRVATLEVRLWRGTALAAGLTIKGLPAYAFIDQQKAAQAPKQPRPRCRFAKPFFPYTLFQQIDPNYLSAIADAFNAPITLPIDRELLDHTLVRKCLLPPERAPFLPPKARNARERKWNSIRWDFHLLGSDVAPLVELPPIADLDPAIPDGLTAVCKLLVEEFKVDFLLSPPASVSAQQVQDTLAKAVPNCTWLLPCADPLPEGLSPERLILICSPDAPPPARFTWFARTPYPCGDPPPGAKGWFIEASPFRLPPPPADPAALLAEAKADPETLANTEACNHFIEAFAALANARYAQTQDPRLAACFDELLLYHSWRTCDALYNAVTTPEAYGQALDFIRAQQSPGALLPLDFIRAQQSPGALLPLGGGLNAKPNAKPAPTRKRDFARLLSLAEELLTP
ncbi:MAG: hypothetical protein ACI4W7_01525 [Candidatus Spyradenecus sp.]